MGRREYNRQYFSKEQVEGGVLTDFVSALLRIDLDGESDMYNDIHITRTTDYGMMVEWVQIYEGDAREDQARFEYLEGEEFPVKYYEFPDGHFEIFETEEDFESVLKEWLEEHKDEEWYKNEYGQWRSKKEQREFEREYRKQLAGKTENS